jgi:uncharacterized protein (DUF1778 family)
MSKTKVSIDVRVDPSDKAALQTEADAAGVSLSELVRRRVQNVATVTASTPATDALELTGVRVNLDSEVLAPLRCWLALEDSDGEVDPEQIAEWKEFAASSGIHFDELLSRVVLYANLAYL